MPAIKDKSQLEAAPEVNLVPRPDSTQERLAAQAKALIEAKFDEQNKYQLFTAIVNGLFAAGLNAQLNSANVDNLAKHAAGLADRFFAAYKK